jgi:hypothetical protein
LTRVTVERDNALAVSDPMPARPEPATPPPDPLIVRFAAAALGVSVVAAVVGVCVAAAVSATIPDQLWIFANTLAGALLGLLVPTPTQKKPEGATPTRVHERVWVSVWQSRVFLTLLFVFVFSAIFSDQTNSKELLSLAGAAGGALLGLLVPTPAKKE